MCNYLLNTQLMRMVAWTARLLCSSLNIRHISFRRSTVFVIVVQCCNSRTRQSRLIKEVSTLKRRYLTKLAALQRLSNTRYFFPTLIIPQITKYDRKELKMEVTAMIYSSF